jgi:hypothetical protein
MITPIIIRYAGHLARIGEKRNCFTFFYEKTIQKDKDERIILNWNLDKRYGALWTGFLWLRTTTGEGLLLTWQYIIWLREILRNISVGGRFLASQEGLGCMELLNGTLSFYLSPRNFDINTCEHRALGSHFVSTFNIPTLVCVVCC